MEWKRGEFLISDNRELLDIETIIMLLGSSYWAKDRDRKTIEKSMQHSFCFGVYDGEKQIGFARVVSDKTVFSWVMDVIIDDSYRGMGIGKWLIDCILQHPDLKETKFALDTLDAHEFYRRFGFEDKRVMRRPKPLVY